jgi:hypothetical protein
MHSNLVPAAEFAAKRQPKFGNESGGMHAPAKPEVIEVRRHIGGVSYPPD